jgi:hypothetical protein
MALEYTWAGRSVGKNDQAGDSEEIEVEPALLTLVCHQLDLRRKMLGLPAITEEVVAAAVTMGPLLGEFYDSTMADMPQSIRRFVEDELVTASATGLCANYPRLWRRTVFGRTTCGISLTADYCALSTETGRSLSN